MTRSEFIQAVGEHVEREYGSGDGDCADAADLASSLLSMGVINLEMGVEEASAIVAQHILQA